MAERRVGDLSAALIGLIGDPGIEGPVHVATLSILGLTGLVVAYLALGLRDDERGWMSGLFARNPDRPVKPPRRTKIEQEDGEVAAPPSATSVSEEVS